MSVIIDNINKTVTLTFKDGRIYTLSITEWSYAISHPKKLDKI